MPKDKNVDENLLVVCDLETGGLDRLGDWVLEAGMVLVDRATLKVEAMWNECYSVPAAYLRDLPPVVREMHEKTGLLDRVRRARLDQTDVDRSFESTLGGWGFSPENRCRFVGNGFDRFDRQFLARLAPCTEELSHYASLDVSAVRRWLEDAGVDAQVPEERLGDELEHTALGDCMASLRIHSHLRAQVRHWWECAEAQALEVRS